MTKKYTNHWTIGILAVVILIGLHMLVSAIPGQIPIKRALKPARDIAFLPSTLLIDNNWEIYCYFAEHGLLDYNRCIAPPAPSTHLSIPEGPPQWFTRGSAIVSLMLMIIMYAGVFKVMIFFKKTYDRTTKTTISQ